MHYKLVYTNFNAPHNGVTKMNKVLSNNIKRSNTRYINIEVNGQHIKIDEREHTSIVMMINDGKDIADAIQIVLWKRNERFTKRQ